MRGGSQTTLNPLGASDDGAAASEEESGAAGAGAELVTWIQTRIDKDKRRVEPFNKAKLYGISITDRTNHLNKTHEALDKLKQGLPTRDILIKMREDIKGHEESIRKIEKWQTNNSDWTEHYDHYYSKLYHRLFYPPDKTGQYDLIEFKGKGFPNPPSVMRLLEPAVPMATAYDPIEIKVIGYQWDVEKNTYTYNIAFYIPHIPEWRLGGYVGFVTKRYSECMKYLNKRIWNITGIKEGETDKLEERVRNLNSKFEQFCSSLPTTNSANFFDANFYIFERLNENRTFFELSRDEVLVKYDPDGRKKPWSIDEVE